MRVSRQARSKNPSTPIRKITPKNQPYKKLKQLWIRSYTLTLIMELNQPLLLNRADGAIVRLDQER